VTGQTEFGVTVADRYDLGFIDADQMMGVQ